VKPFNVEEVRQAIMESSPETRIYIGADSERRKKDGVWHYDVTVAVIIHIDGCRGCRVYGELTTERDYDFKKDRPSMRLMKEVEMASEMYRNLEEAIGERAVEIHLDINTDEMHGSSCVLHQAIGYIRGTCGITPKVKPEAWGASHVADRLENLLSLKAAATR
jgi:predicted RNase H-related nuclease YkuK (DUF458 family)